MKTSIIGVVFSRDRAMQLDGTLRSFFLHCKDADEIEITVIYKATSTSHKAQYDQLGNDYAKHKVNFIEECSFRHDLLKLLREFANGHPMLWLFLNILRAAPLMGFLNEIIQRKVNPDQYVLFLVDDNLFVRDFSLDSVVCAMSKHSEVIGFSLRLGKNIDFSYPTRCYQSIPPYVEITDEILKFNWTSSTRDSDFACPLEVSSSIYRVRDVLPFLKDWRFENPNSLENVLAGKGRFFARRQPYLLCYSESVTFCNPINIVQHTVANRAGSRLEYSAEKLLVMFEGGYRINVENYADFIPNSCHQEVELMFSSPQATE